jgi:hypothetical protein
MRRTAGLTLWWVSMRCQNHLGAQLTSPLDGGMKIVDFEPQEAGETVTGHLEQRLED